MERRTADPSTPLRSGRDDKLKGGGPPWQWWKWRDRTSTTTRLRLPAFSSTHSASCVVQKAIRTLISNLDSSDFQPSPFGKLRAGSAGLDLERKDGSHAGAKAQLSFNPLRPG